MGVTVLTNIKQGSLVVCLLLFLFAVISGGLYLNPGGAFFAGVTDKPLVIHALRGWEERRTAEVAWVAFRRKRRSTIICPHRPPVVYRKPNQSSERPWGWMLGRDMRR